MHRQHARPIRASTSAQVYVVNADNGSWSSGEATGLRPQPGRTRRLPSRYRQVAEERRRHRRARAMSGPPNRNRTPRSSSSATLPCISRTSAEARRAARLVALVVVPRDVAFATIYKNQMLDSRASWRWSLVLTLVLGWFFGRWFIRPLLEIIEVTQQLQEGQLYNRTRRQARRRAGRPGRRRSTRWSTSCPR